LRRRRHLRGAHRVVFFGAVNLIYVRDTSRKDNLDPQTWLIGAAPERFDARQGLRVTRPSTFEQAVQE
jgi:hypothetical protein